MGRPVCAPNRSAFLLPAITDMVSCFRLDEQGLLAWRHRPVEHFASEAVANKWNAQYAGRPVKGRVVAVTLGGALRKVVAERIRSFLTEGKWPAKPNRRTGVGAVTKKAREAADRKLVALMRKRPMATVFQLALALKMSRPSVSRRIQRLKALGLVAHGADGWTIEAPTPRAPKDGPWVHALTAGTSYLPPVLGLRNPETKPVLFQRYG